MTYERHKGNRNHGGAFGNAVSVFVAVTLGAKLAWAWLVPSLAQGAVRQGLISGSLPWTSALLLGLVVAGVAFFLRHPRRHEARREWSLERQADA